MVSLRDCSKGSKNCMYLIHYFLLSALLQRFVDVKTQILELLLPDLVIFRVTFDPDQCSCTPPSGHMNR